MAIPGAGGTANFSAALKVGDGSPADGPAAANGSSCGGPLGPGLAGVYLNGLWCSVQWEPAATNASLNGSQPAAADSGSPGGDQQQQESGNSSDSAAAAGRRLQEDGGGGLPDGSQADPPPAPSPAAADASSCVVRYCCGAGPGAAAGGPPADPAGNISGASSDLFLNAAAAAAIGAPVVAAMARVQEAQQLAASRAAAQQAAGVPPAGPQGGSPTGGGSGLFATVGLTVSIVVSIALVGGGAWVAVLWRRRKQSSALQRATPAALAHSHRRPLVSRLPAALAAARHQPATGPTTASGPTEAGSSAAPHVGIHVCCSPTAGRPLPAFGPGSGILRSLSLPHRTNPAAELIK